MLGDNPSLGELARLRAVTELIQTRMAHLTEATDLVGPFYVADDAVEVADDARAQLKDDAGAGARRRRDRARGRARRALRACSAATASFTAAAVEAALREALVDGLGIKPKFAFGPLRTAVSGRRVSPPLFESMEILGKASTLARLRALRADAVNVRLPASAIWVRRRPPGRIIPRFARRPAASRKRPTAYPMGYGVIGNTGDSGSSVLGSSPGTPALVLGLRPGAIRRNSCRSVRFFSVARRLARQAKVTAPLCSGLARRPLKAVARVRIPSGLPSTKARSTRTGPSSRPRCAPDAVPAHARWALTASWATRRRATSTGSTITVPMTTVRRASCGRRRPLRHRQVDVGHAVHRLGVVAQQPGEQADPGGLRGAHGRGQRAQGRGVGRHLPAEVLDDGDGLGVDRVVGGRSWASRRPPRRTGRGARAAGRRGRRGWPARRRWRRRPARRARAPAAPARRARRRTPRGCGRWPGPASGCPRAGSTSACARGRRWPRRARRCAPRPPAGS